MWVLDILDMYKPLLQAHWTLENIFEILNFANIANILGLLKLYFSVLEVDYFVYVFPGPYLTHYISIK